MKLKFTILFLFINIFSFSQDTTTLLKNLETASNNEKVDIYNELAWCYRKTNPQRGIYFGEKSLLLADSIKYYYGKCLAYNFLGVEYRNLGNYSMTMVYYQNGLDIAKKHNFIEQEAYGYNNFGNLYLYFNLTEKAIAYLKLADNACNKIQKNYSSAILKIKSYISFNLGQAYIKSNKPDSAIIYLNSCIDIINKIDTIKNPVILYNSISGIEIFNQLIIDTEEKKGVIYKTIGDAYTLKNNFNAAQDAYKETLNHTNLDLDNGFAADYYFNIANMYFKINATDSAIFYANKSLNLSKNTNSEYYLMKSYELLSEIWIEQNNYKEAYKNINLAFNAKTKIFNEELENNIQSFEYTNEELKRQTEINSLNKNLKIIELENKKNKIKLFAITIIVILLLTGFIVSAIVGNKFKKYSNILKARNSTISTQNTELKTQKEELLVQKEIIQEHSKEIQASISYASSIQKALLPSSLQIEKYFDYFNIYLPKNVVSGDFYWFSDIQPNYLFFITADCTGHGVPAGFISVIAMQLFNNFINDKKISDPKRILLETDNALNKFLHKLTSENIDGLDTSIIRFDKNDKNKILFSGAKLSILIHNKKTNEIIRHRGVRRSVGSSLLKASSSTIEFKNIEIPISEYCTLYCYTDGYIDQNNIKGKKIGTNKTMDLLLSIGNLSIKKQENLLLEYLNNFRKGTFQRDDITIIGLKRK